MYSEPQIYNPTELGKRAFVYVYLKGKRHRFYNGSLLGITCNPNYCKTIPSRDRELRRLARELYNALKRGWTPDQHITKNIETGMVSLLAELASTIPASFSQTYRRDIRKVCEEFTCFLKENGYGTITVNKIETSHIEAFLQRFGSSGTYYMNKRRTLSAAFLRLQKMGLVNTNPVAKTSKRKSKAVLHQAYTGTQLIDVLGYLQEHYPNLHLCALLMYGTLLRPHREIRLLKRRHFDANLSQFTLDGYENKSGRLRSLPVPEYVKEELLVRGVDKLEPEINIFTGLLQPYNESYFNTQWSRAKEKMLQQQLIQPHQTLYSFRHAASVNVFERTQNLRLLQHLLGHSNINTSMTYLRSLGAIQVDNDVMPEL
jgi:integrase